jgi:uncharacterized protein (TIGR02145 family)
MSKWYVLVFTFFFCCSTFGQTSSIQVQPGWNLLSLPVNVPDNAKDVLFPSAKSKAFIYRAGYQAIDSIKNGQGFWLKFDSTETISITGEEIYTDTIDVTTGWNMIGSISIPVAIESIKTDPPGIVVSDYFYYAPSGYVSADTLQPSYGYWVKIKQDGFIISKPGGSKDFSCPEIPSVEYAGKTYHTIQIEGQCWLRENLDVGTMIAGVDTQKNNITVEKYCYSNDTNNCNTYGGLYQWWEAMHYSTTSGAQGICPPGWHIPTYAEFQTLSATVGDDGNALKEIGQGTGAGDGTNTSGFSALLSGHRDGIGGFFNLGYSTYFWSSTESNTSIAFSMYLYYNDSSIDYYTNLKEYGFSVRCVKD